MKRIEPLSRKIQPNDGHCRYRLPVSIGELSGKLAMNPIGAKQNSSDFRLSPTSRLSESDIRWIADFLKDRAVFSLYFQCALDALKEGLDNRSFYIGSERNGLIMTIRFDDCTIFTSVGSLRPDELVLLLNADQPSEIHAEVSHADFLIPLCKDRITMVDTLRYYELQNPEIGAVDGRCRRLASTDIDLVRGFFKERYPQTIFSAWMLDHLFLGLFDGDELLATGGVIILNRNLRICNIGNFLTAPRHRGLGLAKVVARSLIELLRREGMDTFTLGTTNENISAWRAYEAIGFKVVETRPQIDLLAISSRDEVRKG